MKRSMFQLYLDGCDEAIALYTEAFGARLMNLARSPEDGGVIHAEMDAFGQVIALSDRRGDTVAGNTMQLCFHFGEGGEALVRKAFAALSPGALAIECPPSPLEWSPCMAALTDRFGVRWCLFE